MAVLESPPNSKLFEEYDLYFQQLTKVKEDWELYIKRGNTNTVTSLRPEVLSSWKRSLELGLDPYNINTEAPGYLITPAELEKRLESNKLLVDIATPLLEALVSTWGDPRFRIDFFDHDLFLLKQYGHPDSLNLNNYSKPGVNRMEKYTGTNAVALAYILQRPVRLTGPEHFCVHLQNVTCSSVPLYFKGKEPSFKGIINIYGPSDRVQPHTLGMAVALSKAIELAYNQHQLLHEKALAFHYIENIVDSISDGLIALDATGHFTIVNRNAGRILSITPNEVIGKNINDVFTDDTTILANLSSGLAIQDEELIFSTKTKRKRVFGNFTSTTDATNTKSYLSVFKEGKHARAMANNLAGFKAYFTFDDLKGKNQKFINLLRLAKHTASMSSNVLILGESGTGKELFAQSIHNASNFSSGPFIGLNCGAIPTGLIESELFGYEAGAFTGGKRDGQAGKLALAEGGTLFLDEIDSLSLANQSTLLRVLQSQTYTRVGGTTELKFKARLIVASNCNLWDAVCSGRFRQDLYFRINVLVLDIPPLRERLTDVPELALYFNSQCQERLQFNFTIADEALSLMKKYSWPGNVRELENVIERCAVLAYSLGKTSIDAELLTSCNLRIEDDCRTETDNHGICLADMEKQTIERTLTETSHNILQAAKILGITRKTLYHKMRKYEIDLYTSRSR